jgi:NAD-dependent deacetylase
MELLYEKIKEAVKLLEQSHYTIALTGAGISEESGIVDFRSSDRGLWTMLDPDAFTIQRYKENPNAFYEIGAPYFNMLEQAKPNETHIVLAEMEKRGLVRFIITKNVDGLHQVAGSKNVLEIYGTLKSASCVSCSLQVEIKDIATDIEKGLPPLCTKCGKPLKPDMVFAGEPLPPGYYKAHEEANRADLVIIIGTNILASPTKELLEDTGALIIINRTPTAYDQQAKVVINDSPARVMKLLLEELDSRNK